MTEEGTSTILDQLCMSLSFLHRNKNIAYRAMYDDVRLLLQNKKNIDVNSFSDSKEVPSPQIETVRWS
jgi:hypothetical protein